MRASEDESIDAASRASRERVFFITGGASGIGAATARRALAAGHRVFAIGRDTERLKRFLDESGGTGRLAGRVADATDWNDTQAAVHDALERFGRLDVAFANAGLGAAGDLATGDPGRWREMILTNVYGVALTIKACLPPLIETRGRLILAGSVVGRKVVPGSLYAATKAAVMELGESVRQQVRGTGVGVTVIVPGRVDTPFWPTPIEGGLSADDVAAAVLWAVEQPERVDVNEILVRPTGQEV